MNSNNKRIAKNTLMLYFRMMLIMGVTLYTSRVVLEVLGVEDFGIYNVVGGVVVMFGFLNSAMSSATQRFLSFELGRKDYEQLKKVFSLSVTIHALIAVVIFALAETIGLWFLNTQLTIPAERMNAANWVYQFSIFAFMVNVMAVPYNAAIVSHERMNVYAYVSIIEAILKLAIVFALQWFGFDKLKLYAILVFVVSFIIRMIYQIYCKRKFEECKYQFIWDREHYKQMGAYAGWNLFGALAAVGFDQGINFLLNIFYGPSVNAARGISYQVNGAVNQLIANFQIAINPQLIKFYAKGNKEDMFKLAFRGSRFSCYLMLLLGTPVLFQAKQILSIWLTIVPEYTVIFTQLIIINSLIYCLSNPLMTIAQASGRIKHYQVIVGGLLLLNIPISYVLLKLEYSPKTPMVVMIIITLISLFARLIILRSLVQLPIKRFCKEVLLNIFSVTTISFLLSGLLCQNTVFTSVILQFAITTLLILFVVLISIAFIGMRSSERQYILIGIQSKFQRK